jgi:hypothetical protein
VWGGSAASGKRPRKGTRRRMPRPGPRTPRSPGDPYLSRTHWPSPRGDRTRTGTRPACLGPIGDRRGNATWKPFPSAGPEGPAQGSDGGFPFPFVSSERRPGDGSVLGRGKTPPHEGRPVAVRDEDDLEQPTAAVLAAEGRLRRTACLVGCGRPVDGRLFSALLSRGRLGSVRY